MKLEGIGAIVVAALLWSSGGLGIKWAPMPALAVVCGRSLVTVIFYLLVLKPDLRRARWSTAVAYAGMVITFVSATKLTTAANAIFLQYTGPVYVLALAPFVLKEKFRAIDAVAIALSLAGMSLFFVDKMALGRSHDAMLGDLLGVASGFFFAGATLTLRRDAASGDPGGSMPSATLGNLTAAALVAPWALPQMPAALSGRGIAVLLYLGIVQMGIAYWLFNRGLKKTPAVTASLVTMLEPVFNPIWVLFGTGERPGVNAAIGGGIVLFAVALRTWWVAERRA